MNSSLASQCAEFWHHLTQLFDFSNSFHHPDYTYFSLGGLLLLIVSSIFFTTHTRFHKFIMRYLLLWAILIFLTGFLLYMMGFAEHGTSHNPMALTLRAVMASIEMFVSKSELIEVGEALKKNVIYMLLFATTHWLAICTSAAFIIHIMGTRFTSFLKMFFQRWSYDEDLYVFFDLSKASLNMAEEICKKYNEGEDKGEKKGAKRHFRIVFVKTPNEESHLERFTFSHILNYVNQKDEAIEKVIDLGALLTYSRKSISLTRENWKEKLGLKQLARIIDLCKGKRYFFCLSENEDVNMQKAVSLDRYYNTIDKQDRNIMIYCRANHDSLTENLSNPYLKFIDSGNLTIKQLKRNVLDQPVSFVCPDTKRGVATKPFKAMIVGFGETGYEAFSFLYEFSAFVGPDGGENPYAFYIIDPNAAKLEQAMYIHCPDLEAHKDAEHSIQFMVGTVIDHKEEIRSLITELDYIVVSTDNDQLNLKTAIILLEMAYKYREPSQKLHIYVGVNEQNFYQKACILTQKYNQEGRKDDQSTQYLFTVIPFGELQHLFTYDNIIKDSDEQLAMRFYHNYEKTGKILAMPDAVNRKDDGSFEAIQKEWNERRNSYHTDGPDGLYKRNKLKQQESQDLSNAHHVDTKLVLADILPSSGTFNSTRADLLMDCITTVMNQLLKEQYQQKMNNTLDTFDSYQYIQDQVRKYQESHSIEDINLQELIENIAKCEHLRWNASNRLQGYRPYKDAQGNQKHYYRKELACLVSYEDLLKDAKLRDTIKYDYNTILVSFTYNKDNYHNSHG